MSENLLTPDDSPKPPKNIAARSIKGTAQVIGVIEHAQSTPLSQEEEAYLDKKLERDIRLEDLAQKKKLNEILHENKELRKKYAKRIFVLTCIWTALIYIIIFLLGFQYVPFNLSDKVAIALITSTTINFFGFFLLVIKYLFHTGEASAQKIKKVNFPARKE